MPKQRITTRELVDANRKALKDGTLGAAAGEHNCLYVYPENPGVGCAIGICLTDENRDACTENYSRNGVRVTDLDLVRMENLPIAAVTQALHDRWASEETFFPSDIESGLVDGLPTEALMKFVHETDGRKINQETFETWLNLVEREVLS